jgi:hypothetical protein
MRKLNKTYSQSYTTSICIRGDIRVYTVIYYKLFWRGLKIHKSHVDFPHFNGNFKTLNYGVKFC